ncbi:MAG: hypothetical protein AB1600_10325, partial [Bacteroidota bacterium]
GGEGSFSDVKGSKALEKYLNISEIYTNKKKAYTATYKITKVGKDQALQIQANGIVPLRNKKYPVYTVVITGKDYKINRVQ